MNDNDANFPQLPIGWTWVTLDEIKANVPNSITDGPFGSNLKTSHYTDSGPRVIRLQNISSDGFVDERAHISKTHFLTLKKHQIFSGDVVIATLGSPLPRACLIPDGIGEAIVKADCIRFKASEELAEAKYVVYALNSPNTQKRAESVVHGVGRPRLNLGDVRRLPIPLAPKPEQQRIVAAIESHLSRLEEALNSLRKVKIQLRIYRTAVLRHAVEGKLTAASREKHTGKIEPADKLLKRILAERRAKWEEQELAKNKVSGRIPKDQSWKKKYKEPQPPDIDGLPELPDGWVWANFDQLSDWFPHALKAGPFGSSLKKEFYVQQGYKIYGQEQVIRGDPYYGDYYIDAVRYEALKSCAVRPGDILVSLVGTIGKVLILPQGIEPGIINPRLVKLSLEGRLVSATYIRHYVESSTAREFFSISSHGGTMDILNLGILRSLPVPLPPKEEQDEIVQEVSRYFSVADKVDSIVLNCLTRAERLRATILNTAFYGGLVDQDPNDEPASILLERIRAEREKKANGNKRVRASSKATRTSMTKRKRLRQEGQRELFKGQE